VPKPALIADLEQRYKALEDEIAAALVHTPTNDLMIVALKRRLLQLRDEIFRLRYEEDVEDERRPKDHH